MHLEPDLAERFVVEDSAGQRNDLLLFAQQMGGEVGLQFMVHGRQLLGVVLGSALLDARLSLLQPSASRAASATIWIALLYLVAAGCTLMFIAVWVRLWNT